MTLPSKGKEIRAAVLALLTPALPGVEVSDHLLHPISNIGERQIVVISLMAGDRSQDAGDQVMRKEPELHVTIYAAETDTERVEDRVDYLGEQIEEVLLANTTLGGLVFDLNPGPESDDLAEEGESSILVRDQIYNLTYFQPKPT